MANLRKLKITPSKSDGAQILFSIQGRSTNFPNNKPITININQDACYDIIVVCGGNAENKATAKFEAVSKTFGIYLCTPSGQPSWDELKSLEAKIPAGELAWLSASKISIRQKSDKPSRT